MDPNEPLIDIAASQIHKMAWRGILLTGVPAAIAYTFEAAKLKTPALFTTGARIGTDEAARATTIRTAFKRA